MVVKEKNYIIIKKKMVLKNTVEIKLGVLLMHGLKRENIATEDIETFFVLNKKKIPQIMIWEGK